MNRPDWDEYFMQMAEVAEQRSTCTRRKVGAVIVKDKRIMATGYNGVPTGIQHCEERGCLRDSVSSSASVTSFAAVRRARHIQAAIWAKASIEEPLLYNSVLRDLRQCSSTPASSAMSSKRIS